MATMSRWLAPAVLIVGFGVAALSPIPAQAQSGDDLVRVIVDVADVVLRSGTPYYRYGDYGNDDRLIVSRDRYGRDVYYRTVPRGYRNGPPYGNAHGYYRNAPVTSYAKCNKHGKCKTQYYDARYDRNNGYYDNGYYGYDSRRGREDRDDNNGHHDHDD